MSTTSERLGAQAKEVSHDLKEIGDIIRDAVQEEFGHLREHASDYYQQGRDNAQGVASTVEQYVRERPVRSVLIAAGIGVLFGRLWMRR